jgi:acyl-CoA thioester hydrolase
MPVVARVECTYHAPIGYPAVVRVEVHCTRIGRSSVDLLFDMRDAADTRRHFAAAKAVWVWVDRSTGRSAPAPECLRRAAAAASA